MSGYTTSIPKHTTVTTLSTVPSGAIDTAFAVPNELTPEIMWAIFSTCLSRRDIEGLTALACTSTRWYDFSNSFWDRYQLQNFGPELAILDAKTQKVECEDEPVVDKRVVLKRVMKLAPHIEDNAGLTLLTITKGTTFNQLIKIAEDAGIARGILWPRIIEELGDVPVEQTYVTLITNNVFKKSRDLDFNAQKILVEGHGCKMQVMQELFALCVFSNKIFQKCVYGQNPPTYGRTSTHVGGIPLVVGGSAPAFLFVLSLNSFDSVDFGAGGQWKF